MNTLLSSISITNSERLIKNSLLLFIFLYCTRLDTNLILVSYPLLFVLIVTLLVDYRSSDRPIYWVGVIALVMLELIDNYYYSANHHFVLIYLCFIILLASIYKKNAPNIISFNSRIVLSFIFFFAGLQKLLSPEFTDSSYLSYLGINGTLFKPLLLIDDFKHIINENQSIIWEVNKTDPQLYIKKAINIPFKGYGSFMVSLTWGTIFMEFLISLMFLLKPTKKSHIILIFFLIVLLPTRTEAGFIALLSLLGLATIVKLNSNFRLFYLVLFVISLVATYTNYGYF